jgi:hypothetical protein
MGRPRAWLAGAAVVLGLLAGPGVGAGQELPPEIQVDLYMVRADRQIQNREYGAALESLDVVLALQARHGIETPPELWFRHARVALDAGHPQTAIASATRYLQEAGRQGEDYSAALVVLDEAHRQADEREAAATPATPATPTPAHTPMQFTQIEELMGDGLDLTLLFPLFSVNSATMALASSTGVIPDASQLTAAAAGIGVALPISGPFGVELRAQWARKGARIAVADDDATANFDISFEGVDVTALARISPPGAPDLPFHALIGPYVSFELDCRVIVNVAAEQGELSVSDECTKANIESRPVDFGLSAGLAFEMGTGSIRTTLGALYSYGFQDVNKYVGETARHRVFSVQAGIATQF